jgi:spore germination cell wall hydrolase CwlJ-like protein
LAQKPLAVLAALLLVGCQHAKAPVRAAVAAAPATGAHGLAQADAALLALADRAAPGQRPRLDGRAAGWAVFDFANPPILGFANLGPEDAARINAFVPSSHQALAPAPPFHLKAVGAERERAILCLTQAIYYEAALEPDAGQAAVAQTVLNRMRHPAFPKSICGVVYEGSSQPGCQFSFACDGARSRAPMVPFWQRAKAVAERAVNGFVEPDVGAATHYHADYVFPRWGPTLVKITQIGAHIFYRFPGPSGTIAALDRSYAGGELKVSMAGPSPQAILAANGGAQPQTAELFDTYTFADPAAPGGFRTRVSGQVIFGRRVPTREEIARINANLAAMDKNPPPLLPGEQ